MRWEINKRKSQIARHHTIGNPRSLRLTEHPSTVAVSYTVGQGEAGKARPVDQVRAPRREGIENRPTSVDGGGLRTMNPNVA